MLDELFRVKTCCSTLKNYGLTNELQLKACDPSNDVRRKVMSEPFRRFTDACRRRLARAAARCCPVNTL